MGLALAMTPTVAWAVPQRRRPNIIFFLVDDMGWMDSTVYGSEYYETPNMERLAKRSMRFTDAYAASPLCSPTRASIMTGQYPARTGITTAVGHLPALEAAGLSRYATKARPDAKYIYARSRRFLKPEQYTIAEALHDAGYKTAHIGKWHLGLDPKYWPEEQGFDLSFHGAPDPGPPSYHSPYRFKAGTVTDGPVGEYITDRVTAEATAFIEANRHKPFLLHLWHYAVHGPWGHKEEITKTFVGKKDPRGRQDNPIMASMLKSVDESLGRVLDKLDELGIADNTIIIFFSDNGGNVHSRTETDLRAKRIKPGHPQYENIQSYRKYAGFRPPTNNAPLRKGKGWIYEGGTRVPLMVCWPGVVKPHTECSEIVSSIDMYPTMLEMAGVKRKPGQIVDGESIVPLLRQTGRLKREAIFCDFPHRGPSRPAGCYVRRGDWKLIRWFETSDLFPEQFELYNLKDDIGETRNRAAEKPNLVRELNTLIERHHQQTGAALPKKNPAYNPKLRPVQGWRGLNQTALELQGFFLRLTSTRRRTQMHTRQVPNVEGALVFKARMRGNKGRAGIFYWTSKKDPKFVRERRVDFKFAFDGRWHEVALPFSTEGPLTGLRFDACVVPSTVDVDWVKLCKPDGTVLETWSFGAAQ
ncbi:MAG: sulfatase [Kiritimatiellaeota bacterium]|nr:sulfatase [Kiritimatiellota bacterium]